MLIDAHQHFWRIGRNDQSWPTPDLSPIYRDFGPADLVSAADSLGLSGTVLVQSQPSDRDTDWLFEVAAQCSLVKGVVAWADLAAPDAARRIADLAARPKMRGLRPMLQNLERDDWIADPALDAAFAVMTAHNLSLDALVFTRHLAFLHAFAVRHPQVRIVIDHGAKPPIALGEIEEWRREIGAFAGLPQVFCKLSGLLTEAGPNTDSASLKPYVEHLVATFGPERLMWGSDWPVLNLVAGYKDWRALAAELLRPLSQDAQDQVFSRTAARFYRL